MRRRGKNAGQVGVPTLIGITAAVAIAFGTLGYSLAPKAPTQEKVKNYVKDASREDIEEILNIIPENAVKEKATQIYPIAIEDDLDRDVIIASRPKSIVSLAPSVTETLFALGLGDRVIGVTQFCNYPPKVKELKQENAVEIVGGFRTVNVEKVVALEPDLVISTAGVQRKFIESLEKYGGTAAAFEGDNIFDVTGDIKTMGRMTGVTEKAETLAENMRKRMNEIVQETRQIPESEKPKVFYELGANPIYTVGRGTFIHEIIRSAGGINIAENIGKQYGIFNEEKIIKANPDVFIIGVHGSEISLATVKGIKNRFGGIDAVEKDRVHKLPPSEIDTFHRAGPRLVDALKKMTQILHPQLFGEG